MTYNQLAEAVLRMAKKPLTSGEIWKLAVSEGLDKQLKSNGKTPRNTLSSLLGNSRGRLSTNILVTKTTPRKYYLKDITYPPL